MPLGPAAPAHPPSCDEPPARAVPVRDEQQPLERQYDADESSSTPCPGRAARRPGGRTRAPSRDARGRARTGRRGPARAATPPPATPCRHRLDRRPPGCWRAGLANQAARGRRSAPCCDRGAQRRIVAGQSATLPRWRRSTRTPRASAGTRQSCARRRRGARALRQARRACAGVIVRRYRGRIAELDGPASRSCSTSSTSSSRSTRASTSTVSRASTRSRPTRRRTTS